MSPAPFGRRGARVTARRGRRRLRRAGGRRPRRARAAAGPVLHARRGRAWGGGEDERPFLPRAFSVARLRDGRLQFLLEDVGPGTHRLAELPPATTCWLTGPLGNGFTRRSPSAALLVGGGVGIAAAAHLAGRAARRRDAARDAARLPRRRPRARRRAVRRRRASPPTTARSATTASSPSCSSRELDADDARRRSTPAARRRCSRRSARSCAERGVAAQLALESRDGLRLRRLLRLRRAAARRRLLARLRRRPGDRGRDAARGPGALSAVDFCGLELAHPVVNGSGTFDAIAARRVFGDALIERFPFSAFVSKTITLEPRDGNPPPRLWETPAGMINSIGLPNKGLRGYLEHDLPELARLPVPLITNVMGSTRRGGRRAGRGGRRARRGRRDRAQRLLPERQDGPGHRRRPGVARGARARGAAADRQAADRQAHAEHRRRRRGRRGGRGRPAPTPSRSSTRCGRWRCIRDGSGEPWLGGRHGRAERSGGPRGRPRAGRGGRRGASRSRSWAWAACSTRDHAREMLAAGATLVAVGTESFRDPSAGARIAAQLAETPAKSG